MRLYGLLAFGFLIALIGLTPGCKSDAPTPPPIGPEWRVYTKGNSPLGGNRIRCMTLDSDGSIWLGTDSGATHFSPGSGGWSNFKDSLRTSGGSIANVSAIVQGRDRSIWFGTIGAGVIRFNQYSQTGNTWTRFNSSVAPLVASGIMAYKTDPNNAGEIWITSGNGIDRFIQNDLTTGNGTWTHFYPSATVSMPTDNMVSAFLNPINNHFWFGGAIGGAVEAYYDASLVWGRYESPVEQYKVISIAFDLDDNVWFGKEVGASKLNLTSGKWVYYNADSTNGQFPSGAVNAIVTNYHSLRWFGTDSGLVSLNDTTYTKFNQDNSVLPNNRVTALALDLRGNLWIGTQFGLAVYRKGGTLGFSN
ncbi:MAG TPA: two-component regulator propeller domain-containing protein [Bacteroidota bacterium]|nr:two-component regulator propeller domain-containing protein [Bacteroidota bacterium]